MSSHAKAAEVVEVKPPPNRNQRAVWYIGFSIFTGSLCAFIIWSGLLGWQLTRSVIRDVVFGPYFYSYEKLVNMGYQYPWMSWQGASLITSFLFLLFPAIALSSLPLQYDGSRFNAFWCVIIMLADVAQWGLVNHYILLSRPAHVFHINVTLIVAAMACAYGILGLVFMKGETIMSGHPTIQVETS